MNITSGKGVSGARAEAPWLIWLTYGLVLAWQGILLLSSTIQTSLMAHDEGWYATLALGLVRSQDWLSPQWWGHLVYDKTSGLHWLIATAFSLFGVNETVARLPNALACLVSGVLTYAIGTCLLNRTAALLGTLCLSTVILWTQYGQLATQDIPLVAIELCTIWALLQTERYPGQRRRWGVLAGLGLGLGFFVKGFMVALPAIALLPYLVLSHRPHRPLLNPGLYAGLLTGIGLVLLWFWQLWNAHGALPFQQLFGTLALAASEDYHGVGPWYYFWSIPVNFLPWTPLAILGLVQIGRDGAGDRCRSLLLGYPAVLLLLLQIFPTKTLYYPLQLYPFLGLYSGYALATIFKTWSHALHRKPRAIKPLSLGYGVLGAGTLGFGMGLATSLWMALGLFDLETGNTLQPYALPAGVLGLAWLGTATLGWGWVGRGLLNLQQRPQAWLASLLLGPWLAITLAGTSGLLGNYSPDIKAFCQRPEVAAILTQHPVDVVLSAPVSGNDHKIWVLTSFYTVQQGQRWLALEDLPPGHYSWVSPEFAPQIRDRAIATIRNWALIQNRY